VLSRGSGCSWSETPGGTTPFERGGSGRREKAPEAPFLGICGGRERKSERGAGKGDAFPRCPVDASPEGGKLRRAAAPPGPLTRAEGGMHGWLHERKPLKRQCQAGRFGREAQERIVSGKPGAGRGAGGKALESEAQERGKLKDTSEGERAHAAERVAKP